MWPAGPKGSPARRRVTGHTVALSGRPARAGWRAAWPSYRPRAGHRDRRPPGRDPGFRRPAGTLGGRLSSPRAHRRWCT